MALENTGTGIAYAQTITIVKKKDGTVESSTPHSILSQFGNYPAISPTDWSLLSEAQVAQRIADFEQHLQPQYPGLNIQQAKKNEPIITNLTLCPLPSQKRTFTVTLQSENYNLGKCTFTENGLDTITVEEGESVGLFVEVGDISYTFEGWYKNGTQKLGGLQQSDRYTPTEDCTLLAKFKPAKETVIISVSPSVIDNASTHIVNMRATASQPLPSPITVSGTWAFEHGVPNGVSIANDHFNITIDTGQTTGESMIISNFIAEVPTDRIQITSFTRDIESDATYNYDYYY